MSSRQLRKLQKQRELQEQALGKLDQEDAEGEEDDSEPEPLVAKPRASLFAALGDGNDDDEDDNDENEAKSNESGTEAKPAADTAQEAVGNKKSKNAKKKKSKKKKTAVQTAVSEDKPGVGDSASIDDEIDRALKELDISQKEKEREGASSNDPDTMGKTGQRDPDALLAINPHHLRAVNEMISLFGKGPIEAAQQEEQEQQAAELRRQRGHGPQQVNLEQALRGNPQRKLPEVSLRRNIFVQGKDHWPLANAGGLTMKEERRGFDGVLTEFTFHHDQEYDRNQIVFFQVVQTVDPMSMIALLQKTPYHITTLLQVSKVALQDQNPSLAADLYERALFTFGRVTTSDFRRKLEQGKARLDFRRPENREFWLAGYHYLKSLLRKGTHRTALEWARLLYSLNPNDPYAMKNFIHPLAIRSRQAQWLLDFCAEPSFVSGEADDVYMKQTLVLAKLQLGDEDGARSIAVEGMERLPWLYSSLFQALNLDVPPPLWGVSPDGDRQYWTDIYIHQTKELWDNTQATALLKQAVKLAKKVDVKALPPDKPSDLRTARFAFLEGEGKLIGGIPRAILAQQPNYEFDPLPPPLAENIFSSEGLRLPWGGDLQRSGRDPNATRQFLARLQERLNAAGGPGERELGEILRNIPGGLAGLILDDDELHDLGVPVRGDLDGGDSDEDEGHPAPQLPHGQETGAADDPIGQRNDPYRRAIPETRTWLEAIANLGFPFRGSGGGEASDSRQDGEEDNWGHGQDDQDRMPGGYYSEDEGDEPSGRPLGNGTGDRGNRP